MMRVRSKCARCCPVSGRRRKRCDRDSRSKSLQFYSVWTIHDGWWCMVVWCKRKGEILSLFTSWTSATALACRRAQTSRAGYGADDAPSPPLRAHARAACGSACPPRQRSSRACGRRPRSTASCPVAKVCTLRNSSQHCRRDTRAQPVAVVRTAVTPRPQFAG